MTIPDFQTIMRPILAALANGETRRTKDVKTAIADEFRLTDEERDQLLASGKQRVIDNRVGWAITYLVQAGLLERPRRAEVRITDSGRDALRRHPDRIDMRVLEEYPSYREFKERTRERSTISPDAPEAILETDESPQDLISKAEAQNRAWSKPTCSPVPWPARRRSSSCSSIVCSAPWDTAGSARPCTPADPGTGASMASSARTRSAWTGSTFRRSASPPTRPSPDRRSRGSSAR